MESDPVAAHGDVAQRALADIWRQQAEAVAGVAEPGAAAAAVAEVNAGAGVEAGAEPYSVEAQLELAAAHLKARRPQPAIELYESLLADTYGAIDDDARVTQRIKLAQAYRAAGRASAAIDQLEALVAELDGGASATGDDERPIDAQVELATTYVVAHRVKDGVAAYALALARIERVLGSGHRRALSVRVLLARAHLEDGDPQLAIRRFRDLVADAEHALGPDDALTRQARSELASLLRNQGR